MVNLSNYDGRPKWVTRVVRVFFLFMIFNGAVVFARGSARWFGLVLCLTLLCCWLPRREQLVARQVK